MQNVPRLRERLRNKSSIPRLLIFCLLAALLGLAEVAWAGSERIDSASPEIVENAFEDGLGQPRDVPDGAAAQAASSLEDATAAALATQEGQPNVSFVVRLLSPGRDEAVQQGLANGADAISVNETLVDQAAEQNQVVGEDTTEGQEQYQTGDITQNQAKNAPLDEKQRAAIDQSSTQSQSAGAGAVALQLAPANIYVSIRVLSPGDTGPVIQVIGNTASSVATNESETQQLAGSQQESGPDPLLGEYDAPADPTPGDREPADPTDGVGSPGDTDGDEVAAKGSAATSDQPEGPRTELGIASEDLPEEDIDQYYVEPDQYQDLIPDVVLDLDTKVVLDHQLETAMNVGEILAWISSWNWESVAGQDVEPMPESNPGALMTDVDSAVDALLHELELPVVASSESVEATSKPPKPELTTEKAGDSEPARLGSPREPSLVVEPGIAETPATPARSAEPGRRAAEDRADQVVRTAISGRSIVLVGTGSHEAEPRPSVSILPSIGLPRFPSDLLSQGGNPGTGGPASPQAVLPAAVLGLGALGVFLFLHVVFSVWRARGLVLPRERPG